MSKGLIIGLGIVGVIFILVITLVGSFFGFRTACVTFENNIPSQYNKAKNSHSTHFNKIKEMAQIPAMYVEDLKKLYDGAMGGRYGADGSKAIMQWIQEKNPTIDSSLYTKIQAAIEAGRNSFNADQDQLVAMKEAYWTHLDSTQALFFNGFLGFPRIKCGYPHGNGPDDYKIILAVETTEAFKTGVDKPLELRPH